MYVPSLPFCLFSHLFLLPSSLSPSLLFHLPFFTSILPFSPSSISLFPSLPLLRHTLPATLSTTSLQGELQEYGCKDRYGGGVMIWWWSWDVCVSLTGHRRGVATCVWGPITVQYLVTTESVASMASPTIRIDVFYLWRLSMCVSCAYCILPNY